MSAATITCFIVLGDFCLCSLSILLLRGLGYVGEGAGEEIAEEEEVGIERSLLPFPSLFSVFIFRSVQDALLFQLLNTVEEKFGCCAMFNVIK